MQITTILAVALALAAIRIVLTAGLNGVWVSHAAGVLTRMLLPSAIAAIVLVRFFNWRGRLMQVPTDAETHDDLDEAATVTP